MRVPLPIDAGWLLPVLLCMAPETVMATSVCPVARDLPRLTIDHVRDPAVPVEEAWQVFFDGAPMSDAQLALLSGEDPLIELTRQEMRSRGTWVFLGLSAGAVGTAVSAVGWVLFGQDQLDQKYTVAMALGGVVTGILGMLVVTESIQVPLEPHLAPTPRHRLSRKQMQRVVAAVNTRLFNRICAAAAPKESAARP